MFTAGASKKRRTLNVNFGPPYYLGSSYSYNVETKNIIRYDQGIFFPLGGV